MARPLLSIASLLVAVAALTTGNGLLNTLVSLRMAIDRFPIELSGVVMSAYFAGLVAGSLLGGRIIERVGHIRAFAAFAAILTVASLSQALVVGPLPWTVFRAVTGFGIAGELMVAESWLNASATNENRGRVFSVYMTIIYLAFGSGQFLLGLRDPAGSDPFEIVAILLALSIIPIVTTRTTPPASVGGSRVRLRELWEAAPVGLAGSLAAGLSMGAVQSLGPRYGEAMGLGVAGVSQLMGAIFLSGLLLQWPIGRLSDHSDRRKVLALVSLATALVATGIAVAGAGGPRLSLLVVLGGLFGGVAATIYPLSVAFANDRMRAQSVVAVSGGLLLANGLGATAGPAVAAVAMRRAGVDALFLFVALIGVALATYCAYRIRFHPPVPAAEQERFVAVAQTTPAALELDPRAAAQR